MDEPLKLMCVLAHPDDECLGNGGTLAKYAAEGVETYLVTATRGERGWRGDPTENPGLEALGKIREQELRESAKLLGVRCVEILDYIDGDLDQADPHKIIGEIAGYLRQYRPHVVITFDPWGAYGHPDHIAICQFVTAAVICAADPEFHPNGKTLDTQLQSHRVAKLYYMAFSQELGELYQSVFGELVMHVNGETRWAIASPNWGISAVLDTAPYWQQVWQAVRCHRSQHDRTVEVSPR